MSFESRVVFFKRGLTNADLRSVENTSTKQQISNTWNNRNNDINKIWKEFNGTGLERWVDVGDLKIKFLISAVVTGSNEEKIGAGWSGKGSGLTSINGRFVRRDLILSVKNELNWWAKSETGGSVFDVELRCKILSIKCKKDFESEQLTNSEKNLIELFLIVN